MSNNKNFGSLRRHIRTLSNVHSNAKIITAIQALEELRQSVAALELFFMNEKEEMMFEQMRRHDRLNDEDNEMTRNYEDRKSKNKEIINEYQISCQGQLHEIGNVIGQHVGELQGMMLKKHTLLRYEINGYKQKEI